jgi:hypothetical protein
MTPQISISQPLFQKLQEIAEPFVDTPETVISRAVEFYLSNHKVRYKPSEVPSSAPIDAGVMVFQPDAAPDLSFTRPVSIELEGVKFDKAKLYWNPLLFEIVRLAGIKLKDRDKLKRMLLCNYADGQTGEETGYRFIPEANLSVQGQAANPAWKTITHLIKQLGFKLDVTFVWEDKPKAAYPTKTARMTF